MSIVDRVMERMSSYVVLDHKAYDLAIRNLRKNDYDAEFVRKCFGSMMENKVIITTAEHIDNQKREAAERKDREERMKKYAEQRRNMRHVSRRRLRRMCKYFCKPGKKVYVEYEYNNSMGCHEIRSAKGKVREWDVKEFGIGGQKEFELFIKFKNGQDFQQGFHESAMFTGLGKIEECNSGPYCYFTMRFA